MVISQHRINKTVKIIKNNAGTRMKHLPLLIALLLLGCSSSAPEAGKTEPTVYSRYVCEIPGVNGSASTMFRVPWGLKDDIFTGDKCAQGIAFCWWAKAAKQVDLTVRHKFMYIPVPGSTCHYEEAEGKKPHNWE